MSAQLKDQLDNAWKSTDEISWDSRESHLSPLTGALLKSSQPAKNYFWSRCRPEPQMVPSV